MRNLRQFISVPWWRLLGALGLPKERWESLDRLVRRAVLTTTWGVIGILLVALFGTWRASAIAVGALVIALVVPPYRRFPLARFVVPAAVLALAILYPEYRGDLFGTPIFGPFPAMDTAVVMMIFTVMALGLNVVVGY